ncbi:MAG: hypothetical protein ABI813_06445 [Bacteroidota bacterium]
MMVTILLFQVVGGKIALNTRIAQVPEEIAVDSMFRGVHCSAGCFHIGLMALVPVFVTHEAHHRFLKTVVRPCW